MPAPSNKKVLFDGKNQTGENYQGAVEPLPDEMELAIKASLPVLTEDTYKLKMYQIVGKFYGWTYNEFLNTSYIVCKELKKDIDDKMMNMEEAVLDYNHLAILLSLSRLFGGSKS